MSVLPFCNVEYILICCVGNDIHKLFLELNIPSKDDKKHGRKSVKCRQIIVRFVLTKYLYIHAILNAYPYSQLSFSFRSIKVASREQESLEIPHTYLEQS